MGDVIVVGVVGVEFGDVGFTIIVRRIVDRVGCRVRRGWYCWGRWLGRWHCGCCVCFCW